MRVRKLAVLFAMVVASVPAPPAGADVLRVGPDLAGWAPTASCLNKGHCNFTQLEGAAGLAAPVSGTVTSFRMRHGYVAGGDYGTKVALLVFDRADGSLTLRAQSPLFSLATTASGGNVEAAFTTNVPVSAGQVLGLRVESGWQGSETPVLSAAADTEVAGEYVGTQTVGAAATYASRASHLLLFNADIDTAATGGGGQACPTSAGATSKAAVTALATPRTSGRIAVRKGSGRWKGSAVLTNDKFFEPKLVFDRKGRRHVAGRGGAYHDVFYAGPSGKRRVFASAWGGGAGLAIDAKNRPVVGYGDSEARTVNGLIVFCPRFRTQTATAKHKTLRALPDGGDGFEYTELASDPRGGPVHTAYSIGEQLHYHRMGAKPLKLPVSRTRVLRVAVGGGVVAVGSLTDRGVLTVFHRKGTSGAFSKRSLGNGVTHYDLAVGRDGVPRVAFARKGRLHVFNGRKVVASAIPAFRVGIGVDRDRRVHVVFSPADHPNCRGSVVAVWCTNRNGVYHLRLDRGAARGTWTRVQPTVGYSPARYSVATTGRTVAVAYGNPANRVALTVRSRRF